MGGEEPRHKRRWPWILLLVLLAGFGLFKWLTIATPVTRKEAIATFQDENRAEGPHKLAKEVKAEPPSDKNKKERGGHRGIAAHAHPGSPKGNSVSGSGPSSSVGAGPITTAVVPVEGVYTYATKGGEQVSGYKFRDFPDTTYRTLVHTGPRSWTEHHFFIKQRQTWTAFRSEGTSLLADWTRQYLSFGKDNYESPPIDRRIDFDPPLRVLWLPWDLDRTWEGSYEDANGQNIYGSYTARTAIHEYIDVAGEAVEVWMEDLTLQIHGQYEGSTEVKRWTSPLYGVAVREEAVASVWQGPLHYVGDWSVQLTSLEPAR
jgi:hypothetical protein